MHAAPLQVRLPRSALLQALPLLPLATVCRNLLPQQGAARLPVRRRAGNLQHGLQHAPQLQARWAQ